MNDMLKSRPLLLLVVTLCLVVVALVSFWLAALPKRMLASFTHNLATEQGMVLEAQNPQLTFEDGVGLQLENVSLEGKAEHTVSLSAQQMRVGTSFASLFGAGVSAQHLVLRKAVVALDLSKLNSVPVRQVASITFEDSSLRLKDEQSKAVIALSDVNGQISTAADGAAKASLSFLMGDTLTTFIADVENAERMASDGSPTDIVLSAKNMLVAFSGQSKLSKGFELAGQSNIEVSDAAAFMRWFGMPLATLEGVGTFKLQSGFSAQGLTAEFDQFSGQIGEANLTGKVTLAAGVDRAKMTGAIEVSRITALGPKLNESLFAKPWSEQPLPFADAKSIEFNVKVKTPALVLRGRDMGPLEVQLTTDEKNTSIGISQQPFADGQIEGNFSFENVAKQIISFGALNAKGVDAQTFLGGLLGWNAMAGPVDIVTNFKSEGTTPAALVSFLKGDFELLGKNIVLNGVDLQNALSTPNEGWTDAKSTSVQANVVANINEGVMALGRSDIEALNITLKPKGEIDLLRQAFELQLQPKGKDVDPKMTLTGQWSKPVFSNSIVVKEKPAVTPPAN